MTKFHTRIVKGLCGLALGVCLQLGRRRGAASGGYVRYFGAGLGYGAAEVLGAAGVQVLATTEAVRGKRTEGVKGELVVEQALATFAQRVGVGV